MRELTYTGPVDTLEIFDPEHPGEPIFSEILHPGRTYSLPDTSTIVDQMIGRELFKPAKAETAASPVIDTSPAAPAPATVPEIEARGAGKTKRS
ncbi:MAG: hypothetical protein DI527_16415 [Chelatococcus sp.]|nr:MAG: hypothetical protein DI527_16415 [Chelatococcus sp.]